uniref:MFS domain-containing protein n=1 Tax=Panagrellus redivivus TaxID=6233 RepID=A0A7E5A0H0_PANRE
MTFQTFCGLMRTKGDGAGFPDVAKTTGLKPDGLKMKSVDERVLFDDIVINYLGDFGRYQKFIFVLVCLPCIITAMDSLSWTFSGTSIPHRCRENAEMDVNYWKPPTSALFQHSNCSLSELQELKQCPFEECKLGDSAGCPNGYVYETSTIVLSAIQRWDLVCDRAVLKAFIQSTYYCGQMLGSLVFGFLGDRIGRKNVFLIALTIQFFSGIGMALSPHWMMYAICRFGVGLAHPGIFVISVVIGVELVSPKYRQLSTIGASMAWALGQVILGVLAYNIRDYRYLHACIACPALVFISYKWLVPESARWLVAHKRYEEADKILLKAARINKSNLPKNWHEQLHYDDVATSETPKTHHTFLDLVRTPVLRRRSLACFFCWPVCSMLYYGVSMNTTFLGGDRYWTFIFGGLVEFPSSILTYVLIDKIGRKALLVAGFTVSAVAMFSNLLIGSNYHAYVGIFQFLLTKCSITAVYQAIYVYTNELFPTTVRNTGVGACSMMARIGAITASYLALWLAETMGPFVMIIPFASLAIIASVVIMVCLPETAGTKLPETISAVEGKSN